MPDVIGRVLFCERRQMRSHCEPLGERFVEIDLQSQLRLADQEEAQQRFALMLVVQEKTDLLEGLLLLDDVRFIDDEDGLPPVGLVYS